MPYNVESTSEKELHLGILKLKDSWHNDFKNDLYIFISGISERITELDILKVFSQYGNIVDLFFLYDYKKKIRKQYCYLKYSAFESCVLAIDNLNNYKLLDKNLKVAHTKCTLPKHEDFKSYHRHIMKKLHEAMIYEGDCIKTAEMKTNSLQPTAKLSNKEHLEDPMHLVSDELLDF